MATLLDRIAPLVRSVRQDGTAVIGGVQTTRYDPIVSTQAFNAALVGNSLPSLKPSGP